MDHLNKETQEYINKSNLERINYLFQDKWIGYSQAKNLLDEMDELVNLPTINRMPNLLLIGNTNNGKSAILKRFVDKYPIKMTKNEDGLSKPVFCIQAPPVPDEGRFYNLILEEAYIPHKKHDRTDRKQLLVSQTLKELKVKVLVIDEIHHILSGTINKQRSFLNVLKYLSNELKISIVAAGIREAYFAINSDAQLGNRFKLAVLPKWELNEEYLRLLVTFEQMLPLKEKSNLIEPRLANKILAMSQGTIGEISTVLKMATKYALNNSQEHITYSMLDKINYTPPGDRKQLLDKMGL